MNSLNHDNNKNKGITLPTSPTFNEARAVINTTAKVKK